MTEEGMTENVNEHTQGHLLGAADIRRIAADAGISPTKKFCLLYTSDAADE